MLKKIEIKLSHRASFYSTFSAILLCLLIIVIVNYFDGTGSSK